MTIQETVQPAGKTTEKKEWISEHNDEGE